MALKILLHTFRMIFGNLGQALRISVGPYLILMACVSIVIVAIGTTAESTVGFSPIMGILPLVLMPLILFVTAWVAVSWHRFILLEERAGILPSWKNRPIWPYAGRAILLILIISMIAIPLLFVVAIISAAIPFLALPLFAIALTLLGFVGLKMGVSLVGTALGKQMPAGEVWKATDRINGDIFGVVVLLVLFNTIPGFILTGLSSVVPIIGFVLSIALNWLTTMIGISILTTIYGHVIEDRPLVS